MKAGSLMPTGRVRFTAMTSRTASMVSVVILAVAIHADWHLARGHDHGRLSGDVALHWVLALPVFAVLAALVSRGAANQRWHRSAWIVGGGVLVGQVLEPLTEWLTDGVTWRWMVNGPRWTAFAEFMAAGLLTFLGVMGGVGDREEGSGKRG